MFTKPQVKFFVEFQFKSTIIFECLKNPWRKNRAQIFRQFLQKFEQFKKLNMKISLKIRVTKFCYKTVR